MNAKDKFIFGLLGVLIIGAFYFQFLTDELNKRMDTLNLADKEHVDIVLNEFSDSLRVYNLRFIGRGKHLRKAQKDIVANTDLIERNTDSLASMIDDVNFEELARSTPDFNGAQDCAGICNGDSLEDNCVTVRERDSMSQERVAIDQLANYLMDKIRG